MCKDIACRNLDSFVEAVVNGRIRAIMSIILEFLNAIADSYMMRSWQTLCFCNCLFSSLDAPIN